MQASVFIFTGQSGSGKGTQGRLLEKKLRSFGTEKILYLETGEQFRALIKKETFTAQKAKDTMGQGKLPPSFLGIHAWTHILIEEYSGEGHIIIDGTPRVPEEVPVLLNAIKFFNLQIHIINIEVSDEWAHDRMSGRHRADDDERDIWGRIQWYHESVIPTIELLRESSLVMYHCVSGEQAIERVHRDICVALGFE